MSFFAEHHWHFFLGFVAMCFSVVTSVDAILRRRDPRAALWWVGVSWAMPFVGSAAYYFFGINRIVRRATRMRRKRPRPAPSPLLSQRIGMEVVNQHAKHLSSLARLVEEVVQRPLTGGNSVELLVNGDEAYPAMLSAIDNATRSIGLSTYIFNFDRVGEQFVQALARAVQRNVEVRVLIDDVGSGFAWRTVYAPLAANKIPVAYFNPTLAPWRLAYMNLRNHRKILTVDGHIGFTGGMNIHEGHQLALKPPHPCQDIHFQLKGPVVLQMQDAFVADWHFSTNQTLQGSSWFPRPVDRGNVMARGIADGPDEDFEKCRWTILGALSHAKKSVRIVTPYFIPDTALVTALSVVAMSGISVDIVLTGDSDLALVDWASQATLWQVLERGCRVWRTPGPFDHTKLMVIDGGWTLLGSTNWDTRSLRLNFEFNVECYDTAFAEKMESFIDKKISTARPITMAAVEARPFPIKIRDGIARLFSPHL